ncbi:MAG: methionyl-tRNA formyltransferase [Candidatus Moraniibacteriota bacterium]|jgi:methionyl-tRNA formyltransferase
MNKIEGIKIVSKTKHIDVDDQTKESHIDVAQKKDNPESKKNTATVTSAKSEEAQTQINANEDTVNPNDVESTKVLFMGTGKFAGHILDEILKHGEANIVEVMTQPDKKIGRKKSSIHRTLADNPVRDIAVKHEINLFQPNKLDTTAITRIKKLNPDAIMVASYGKILPKEILDIPKIGVFNAHTSLLPKLRGASPVQNALLLGLKETGVTIMKMDEGMDTGDIIIQEKTDIKEHEKADELLARLSKIAADLIVKTAPKLIDGSITATPQDNSKATMCQLIDREDGHIQWTLTTEEIYNRYRAMYPWPGIFSYWEETENQLMRIKLRAIYPVSTELTPEQQQMTAGTVFIGHDQLCIKTFDGAIIVEAVQPECKTVMPVYDFLNGHKTFEGAILK